MALPRDYTFHILLNAGKHEQDKLKKHFRGRLFRQLQKWKDNEWQETKRSVEFLTKNTLFGIPAKIRINWTFKPHFRISIKFDMTEFTKFLIAMALFIGFLGSMTVKHYLIITFIATLLLYALNFSILYVWAKKTTDSVLYSILPEYYDKLEIQKRVEKFGEKIDDFEQKNVSRDGNFIVKYHYKKNNNEKN